MFEHFHPSIGKSEPDKFYINASTQEEYDKGSKIFYKLIKDNFNKTTEKKFFKRYNLDPNPFKKYIAAYLLITGGYDKNKLLNSQ